MYGIGDTVRVIGTTELLTIIEIGHGGYMVQAGADAATKRFVRDDELELVAKATEPSSGPGFVPERSIME